MQRALVTALLAVLTASLAHGQVVPGLGVYQYASVVEPERLSFDPLNGDLYVGAGSFGPTLVHAGGGSQEYFPAHGSYWHDPRVVLVDRDGTFSGLPGTFLIAGNFFAPNAIGRVHALDPASPNQSIEIGSGFIDPGDMAHGPAGSSYLLDGVSVYSFVGGSQTLLYTLPESARQIAVDAAGNIYTTSVGGTIRVHDDQGTLVNDGLVTGLTPAGGGSVPIAVGPGTPPWGTDLVTIDMNAETLLRVDPVTGSSTVLGTGFVGSFGGAAFGPDGALYLSVTDCHRVLRIGGPEIGASYCEAAPNSTGCGASMSGFGSLVIADNDFTLRAIGCPGNQTGLFYYGGAQLQLPFGDGFRCIGGQTHRLLPPVLTSSAGVATRLLDFTVAPLAGTVAAGTTSHVQFWYRDPAAALSGFNLSNGLSLIWQ